MADLNNIIEFNLNLLMLSLLSVGLFTNCISVLAQDFDINHLTVNDGLSQSYVYTLIQDSKGFMWLGTQDGLNKFDGYSFKAFKNEPFDENSLAYNEVSALLEDKKERIWVGTTGNGVNIYIPKENRFIRLEPADEGLIYMGKNVSALFEEADGTILVGTDYGLHQISIEEGDESVFSYPYICKKGNDHCEVEGFVKTIYEDSEKRLWVLTHTGIYIFGQAESNSRFRKLLDYISPTDERIGSNKEVTFYAISEDKLGRILLGAGKDLFVYKGGKSPLSKIILPGLGNMPSFDISIRDILLHPNGDLFISTLGMGIFFWPFNEEKQNYKQTPRNYRKNFPKTGGLNSNLVSKLCLDNKGDVWAGSLGGGVNSLHYKDKIFLSDNLKETNIENIIHPSITSLTKDENNQVWICLDDRLLRLDSNTGLYETITIKLENIETGDRQIFANGIFCDSRNRIFVNTNFGLFQILEEEEPMFSWVRVNHSGDSGEKGLICYKFKEDKEGQIFAITRNNVFILNENTKEFDSVFVISDDDIFENSYARLSDIIKSESGDYWISSTFGLLHFDSPKSVFELNDYSYTWYRHNPQNTNSLRCEQIMSMIEDDQGLIWLATTNGLIEVQRKGKETFFQSYTDKTGLANNFLYEFLPEGIPNTFWISSNGGLTKFNSAEKTFKNFNVNDGLQSNEFNGGAYFKGLDDELLFGGINGFTRFYPDQISSDTIPPKVWINKITSSANKTSSISLLHLEPKEVVLNPNDNAFGIEFLAIDYSNPSQNQYAYKLEGRDDNWIQCGSNRQIYFSGLAPGEYVFQVAASNSDDVWNYDGDKLKICIQPPFWKTKWFGALIFLLVGASVWLFHQRSLKLEVNRVVELERVRKTAAADFHDELGHKLTIISLFSEIVKEQLQKSRADLVPHLNKVIESSNSLYYSMKDMLWTLDPEKDSLYDLLILLKDFGDDLFDKTGINFQTQGLESAMMNCMLPMDYKRHIVLIFKELMNNSLKHSNCSNTQLKADYNGNGHFYLEFFDDGKGFKMDSVNQGNGLKNIYVRAKKINSNIDVNSTSSGTCIALNAELVN